MSEPAAATAAIPPEERTDSEAMADEHRSAETTETEAGGEEANIFASGDPARTLAEGVAQLAHGFLHFCGEEGNARRIGANTAIERLCRELGVVLVPFPIVKGVGSPASELHLAFRWDTEELPPPS